MTRLEQIEKANQLIVIENLNMVKCESDLAVSRSAYQSGASNNSTTIEDVTKCKVALSEAGSLLRKAHLSLDKLYPI